MTLTEILDINLINFHGIEISIYHIAGLLLVGFGTWVILRIIKNLLHRRIDKDHIDSGRGKAFFQLTRYVLVVIAIILGLEVVGVKFTILLAGSAAMLVGLGFGVQQIFNDIVSGIILLFEGTVSEGDIVELDSLVGRVRKIDIRTSKVETNDEIVIVVPNSKLVSENVINWSHKRGATRFKVPVGVAYGSDVDLVSKLLIEAATEHPKIVAEPRPSVRFASFGDSSLDFQLIFYSNDMFSIEFIRSDLRFSIDRKFRESGVTIPFPQRDVHLFPVDTKN